MGKKGRAKAGYYSVGKVGHSMRLSRRTISERMLNQINAWKEGKNVVLRVLDPDKRFINKTSMLKAEEEGTKAHEHLIKVNAREVWGNPNPEKKSS